MVGSCGESYVPGEAIIPVFGDHNAGFWFFCSFISIVIFDAKQVD